MYFDDGYSIQASLAPLTQDEIIEAALPTVITFDVARPRTDLYRIIESLPVSCQIRLRQVALSKNSTATRSMPQGPAFISPTRQRSDQLSARYAGRFDDKHLEEKTCFICGGRYPEAEVSFFKVTDRDHGGLLSPQSPHSEHELHCGMLLHLGAIHDFGMWDASGDACKRCCSRLADGETPPLALANGMWVGELPPQLADLGIIERLIISRSSRALYSIEVDSTGTLPFKMEIRPRPSMHTLDPRPDTYLPVPYARLRDTIEVIVRGDIGPDIYRLLSTNTNKIVRAIGWLQANNPFYRDTMVDSERLSEYPSEGIPDIIVHEDADGLLSNTVQDTSGNNTSFNIFGVPAVAGIDCPLLADPFAFPYGVGPLSDSRLIPVALKDRISHCLRYSDKRFNTTPFVTQAAWYLQEMQIRHAISTRSNLLITPRTPSISADDLAVAVSDERHGRPYTSTSVASTIYDAKAIMSEMYGTQASYNKLASNIHNISLVEGPPSIHIRLGPIDWRHPLIHTITTAYDLSDCTTIAKLFGHVTKYTVLDLFGIQSVRGHIQSEVGIFGKLSGYVTCVGTDDNGALVMDGFLWLRNSPSPSDMQDLLSHRDFRWAFARYLGDILAMDVDQVINTSDPAFIHYNLEITKTNGYDAWVDEDGEYGLGNHSAAQSSHISSSIPFAHTIQFFTQGRNTTHNLATTIGGIVDNSLSDVEARPVSHIVDGAPVNPAPLHMDEASFAAFVTRVAQSIPIPPQLSALSLLGAPCNGSSHVTVTIYLDAMLHHLRWYYSNLPKNIDSSVHSFTCGMEQYMSYSQRDPAFDDFNLLDFLLKTTTISVNTNMPTGGAVPRVLRSRNFKAAPRILSSVFGKPMRDNEQYRWASLVVLLKPWRYAKDILGPFSSFQGAFSQLSRHANPDVEDFLDNFNYLVNEGLFDTFKAKL